LMFISEENQKRITTKYLYYVTKNLKKEKCLSYKRKNY
jgi:hypothetical protein